MKKTQAIIPLFKKFITDTETGRRVKKNGERIKKESVDNYRYVLNNLIDFNKVTKFDLRICDASRLSKKEYTSEKNYWKKFYKKFTDFLYKKGCYDNYVGHNIKVIRTFFLYLRNDRDFSTGDFQRVFYVRKEEVDILVLSPDQLKFLIHDNNFDSGLTVAQKRIKDIFIFGCCTGLRFSDIFLLTNKNFEIQEDVYYLKTRSKKTKTYTSVKLPDYAIEIYQRYKPLSTNQNVFGKSSLFYFNKSLKSLGEKAGFVDPIDLSRERLGLAKPIIEKNNKKEIRFCDRMSSHMMRRTAVTTMLILGMPEHLVRKISGHSSNSNSFNRYVHYAQVYMDKEIDKIHMQLQEY
ncbi:MAG: tyrosine-type recombinase/integrase [bacterium]|nr:tyrosine-type recombinase/integrase [bacterium]